MSTPSFVSDASSSKVVVKDATPDVAAVLGGLGSTPQETSSLFAINVADDRSKAEVFRQLQSIGVCFAAGADWSPAEVLEYLRDFGMLCGKYRCIAWRVPGVSFVEER